MAVSNTFNTNNQYIKYRIETTVNSQDYASNTSNVTVKVFVWRTNTGYTTYGTGTCYCSINGSSNYSKAITSSQKITSSGIYIFSHTLNIEHDDDGKKKLSVSAYIDHSQFSSSSNSATFDLPTIPRTSTVSCNSFFIGDSTTINIGKKSSSFTHTLKYVYGDLTGTIATKTTASSIGWTPDKALFYSRIPNGTTGYGSITCETYSGDTLIGTATTNFNAYAKQEECTPSVSATIIDTNADTVALTGDNTKLVKYLSKPKVTITATPKYSASIKSVKALWGDGNSSAEATKTFTDGVTSNSLLVSTTDSRAYTTNVNYNLSSKWVEYIPLAFSRITLSRTESTLSTANIKVSGNYFNGNFGKVANDFTLKYRYKPNETGSTFTDYIQVDTPRTNDTFDYSATLENIDYRKEYIFEFVLEDKAMIVFSGEQKLEKGQAIFRIGEDYTRTNGRMLDEYGTTVANGLSVYRTNGVEIDPDVTLEDLVLTETNTPTGGFWYIRTMFYSTKTPTSNRTQVAYPYAYSATIKACAYMRTYVAGIGWSNWSLISARCETGWITITPTAANTPTAVYVAFKNSYNKVPNVVVSAGSGAIGTQVLGVSTNGITTTGVNIVLTRTNTTPTTVHFQVQEEV
jgi:hypothetical protein